MHIRISFFIKTRSYSRLHSACTIYSSVYIVIVSTSRGEGLFKGGLGADRNISFLAGDVQYMTYLSEWHPAGKINGTAGLAFKNEIDWNNCVSNVP